jgi:hypothetical protein
LFVTTACTSANRIFELAATVATKLGEVTHFLAAVVFTDSDFVFAVWRSAETPLVVVCQRLIDGFMQGWLVSRGEFDEHRAPNKSRRSAGG